jgi:hypothetical protein
MVSISVGAMRASSADGGRYIVSRMSSGRKTFSSRYRSSVWPDTRSTIRPARYAPMSLYTMRAPGSMSSGSVKSSRAMLSALVVSVS